MTAPPPSLVRQPSAASDRARWRLASWAAVGLALAAGLIDYWGTRYDLNPDGVSYVEMARHALTDGKIAWISGYWSPGYPMVLTPLLPSAPADWNALIPRLHLVNLLLYLVGLWIFVRQLRGGRREDAGPPIARYAVTFGACAFAVIGLQDIGIGLLTPDFGVLLAVLATVWCCLALERPDRSWRAALMLGAVLGGGYWLKGILLPLNAGLIGLLLLRPPRADRARVKVLVSAAVCLTVSLPLVVMVSRKLERPSVGDVGKLNYAWQVDGVTPDVGWLGDSARRYGTPIHPPRVIQFHPLSIEFASPVPGTYPLWYDPSYWYQGLHVRFELHGQWRALREGLGDLGSLLLDQWAVLLALAAVIAGTRRAVVVGARRMPAVIGAWSIGAMGLYALVHVEPRYLAGFEASLVLSIWLWLRGRTPRRTLPWMITVGCAALLISLGRYLRENTGGFETAFRPDYFGTAGALRQLGVQPGDRIGVVGDAFEQYAAVVDGTPIAAQVLDTVGYWNLSSLDRAALNQRFAGFGVRALLANDVEPAMAAEGWRILSHADSSNTGMLVLRPGPRAPAMPGPD